MENEVLQFIANPHQADFDALALAVFAYQFERNIPYQRFCVSRRRTPAEVSRWQDIPAVPALAFKELELSCGPAEKIFQTSGTTRGPDKRGRHFVPDLRLYRASALGHFSACVLPDDVRLPMIALIPSLRTRPDSSLSQMADWIMTALGTPESRHCIDEHGLQMETFVEAVDQAHTSGEQICVLAITPALVAFFDWCEVHGRRFALASGSRIMDTGGNKGHQRTMSRNGFLRACWKYLKVPGYYCVNEYGMTELASQFYDNVLCNRFRKSHEPRYKMGPPWTRTLVVGPETLDELPRGKPGLLRHFDLANCGSVLAVQTDDMGYLTGDGFEITGRVPGTEARGCALVLAELRSARKTAA